jgi:hypothetical protein
MSGIAAGYLPAFTPLLLHPLVAPPGSIPVAIKATLYYNAVWQYILIFNSVVDRSSYAIHHTVGCIGVSEQKRRITSYIFMLTSAAQTG